MLRAFWLCEKCPTNRHSLCRTESRGAGRKDAPCAALRIVSQEASPISTLFLMLCNETSCPARARKAFCSSGDLLFCSKSLESMLIVKLILGEDDGHHRHSYRAVNQWQERRCWFYQSLKDAGRRMIRLLAPVFERSQEDSLLAVLLEHNQASLLAQSTIGRSAIRNAAMVGR